jgi:hypothetical protein
MNMLGRRLLCVLAFAAPLAASAQWAPPYVPRPIWGGSVLYGYGGPWIGWPCGGYGCGLGLDYRTQLRRELRLQELREVGPPAAYPAYPFAQHFLPPPTPMSEIQPAYREASQIRPEFRRPIDPQGQ